MQVLPDKVEHVFGTLCSRGCTLDDEGNPKPTCQKMSIFRFSHKISQFPPNSVQVKTWGLAEAREATARNEARVAAIFFCSKSLDCERLVLLGRFELRHLRKPAEIWTAGRLDGFSSEQRLSPGSQGFPSASGCLKAPSSQTGRLFQPETTKL